MNKYISLGIIFTSLLFLVGCNNKINQIKQSKNANEGQQQSDLVQQNNNQVYQYNPGDYNFTLQVGNLTRKYLVHVPKSYDKNKATPLILAFHGGLGTAEIMAQNYDLIPKSDEEGFIVAFPNGTSRLPSGKLATWNAGNCCGYALENNINDIDFTKAVIDDIKSKFNIDKIFATGMSNGGMLSHRLACEMSDTFTAIAAVSGTNNFAECNPKKPISIMHIHGLKDDHVLFDGGWGPKSISKSDAEPTSVPNTISEWVKRNNCNKKPQKVLETEGAYCDLYTGCDDNVQVKLCAVKDGGHSWPGIEKTVNPLEQNTPSQSISATDEIWDFFKNQK